MELSFEWLPQAGVGLDPLEDLGFGNYGTSPGHRHDLTLLSQLRPRVDRTSTQRG